MDETMREHLKAILNALYGEHVVKNWSMSDDMASVLIEFLKVKKECNDLMGMVPMPYTGKNPLKYMRKDVLGRVLKSVAESKETIGCLNCDKAAYRSKFENAGMGSY